MFCQKVVLEISSKILQKYLKLSSYPVNELWVWLLLKFCLFFDSAKEASSDVSTFLNMRFITAQKPAFWENITLTSSQLKKVSLKTFCRKWYLAEFENVPAISNILCSYWICFGKSKNNWFLHAQWYLKNGLDFFWLKYLQMRVQNLYINSPIINQQWSNSRVINTSQLNYPLSF